MRPYLNNLHSDKVLLTLPIQREYTWNLNTDWSELYPCAASDARFLSGGFSVFDGTPELEQALSKCSG